MSEIDSRRSAAGKISCGLVFGLAASALFAPETPAATIYVNPGQTIASGIASATAGDTVVVRSGSYFGEVVLTRSIVLEAEDGVVVRPAGIGGEVALTIKCSDCRAEGFLFEDFQWAVLPDAGNRDRVTIRNCVFRRSATAWIRGDSWLIEGCEFDRPLANGLPADAEDYMNVWGSNHTIRRCYFHGLQLLGDIPDGAHSDCIQMFNVYNSSLEHLNNLLVEECIFADFVQGIHITNDANASPSPISNITVKNCVFWGSEFPYNGSTAWSAHGTLFRNHIPSVRLENNIYRKMWNNVSLYGMDSIAIQGNIFVDTGNAYSLGGDTGAVTPSDGVSRGTMGNLVWNVSDIGLIRPLAPDAVVDPQLRNPNARTGADLIGPDGVPWTADDAWRPMNPAAAAFGPQVTLGGGGTGPINPSVLPGLAIERGVSPLLVLFLGSAGGCVLLHTTRRTPARSRKT